MREFVTPRIDMAFKKIFGVEENKDLLISLINSIVSEEDQLKTVELLNPYNPQNFRNDKLSILDIKAMGANGKRYNIEIQISDEADYDKRALYYWAKLYTEQLTKQTDYSSLNKAIGIHILNFTSIPKVEKYHNVFRLLEVESKLHHFKDIELHTIELSKFDSVLSNRKGLTEKEKLDIILSQIKTSLDRWVAFLSKHELLEVGKLPKEMQNNEVEKALQVLEELNFNKEERDAYEDHLKWYRMELSTIKNLENKIREEGIKKGRAEGKAEGRAEGKAEGRAEGKAEGARNKAYEIADRMLAKGVEVEDVIEVTGLTAKEITKLKAK